ncbi:uncharacterized protein LOC115717818 [Cannabis sativa]|uniref:uncharacterized protein LOC115717818 n=1 Tax=Cannabis sativa TaxID=3483 RepID=UPI0029CA125D|nr:uncharacterized protein LOC115717818 [Cannabis sativa]
MAANNPMVSLLTDNKLNGANSIKWRENINIALIGKNFLFVLTEEALEQPGENATKAVKEKFESWQNANNKARYFMLSSMVNTLKTRFANTLTTAEIMNLLTELFGMASIQARFEATKIFINARMRPHHNVRDHLLQMTSYFQEAENHGAVIDQTTQVSLILNSLTPTFLPFTSNYVMNKLELDFHELINNLLTFENLIGGAQKGGSKAPNSGTANGTAKVEANIAFTSKPSKEKSWKNSKKPLKVVKTVKKKKAANPDAKQKGKCFYCNEKGH